MDLTVLFFLTSGLFLGWSLGANDAANIFGTAVGTRMVRFTTAAIVCSVFVILGAVISGAGATHTLGTLGAISALAGAFMVALAAALTVYVMTTWGLPVSTSQAIVGAIIGWNVFSESVTDTGTLLKIFGTWVACPLLAAVIAGIILKLAQVFQRLVKLHLLRLDAYSRLALIFAGAFGAYSLGANNIANVMGVFVPASPFTDFDVADLFTLTSAQQLFLLGAMAIAVGVFTYSKRVMLTVGQELLPMSPVAAWVAVIAHAIVLFLFASEGLEQLLASAGLPTIPLVPVSSSQAVIGAVIGIGLARGGREIRWRLLGNIGAGWVTTPIISAIVCFVALFFLQNVFNQQVYKEVHYEVSPAVAKLLEGEVPFEDLADIQGKEFTSSIRFLDALHEKVSLSGAQDREALRFGEIGDFLIQPRKLNALDDRWLTQSQIKALHELSGQRFRYKWKLAQSLAQTSADWRLREKTKVNKRYNKELKRQLDYVYRTFAVEAE
ncbi:MAG: inorganic phosphate transporter [Acidiferrobacterales bacterium]